MSTRSPRIRALLRQANKIAASGKRSAAENLYRQILDEDPEAPSAWVGLAQVVQDEAEQETALERALQLDPENEKATIGLTALRNGQSVLDALQPPPKPDPKPDQKAAIEPERDWHEPATKEARFDTLSPPSTPETETTDTPLEMAEHGHGTFLEGAVIEEEALYCANHPNTLTHLRCNKCGKPVCAKCVRPTPVGYRCKECIREHEDVFYTATPVHYLIAALVGYPLGILAGFFVSRFTSGFFGFLVIFYAAFVGSIIARIVHRVIGRRRGRWMPHLVASAIVLGGLIPVLPILLILLNGQIPPLGFQLIFLGLYVVIATSAAFYQMK